MARTAAPQMALTIDSFQLDNQMLETLRPVVLSPMDVTTSTGPGANRGRWAHTRG